MVKIGKDWDGLQMINLKLQCTVFKVESLRIEKLLTSSSTPTIQFIYIVIWSNTAPEPSGVNSCTAVVSSATIDEREHTAVVASGSSTTGTWGESRSCYSRNQTLLRFTLGHGGSGLEISFFV